MSEIKVGERVRTTWGHEGTIICISGNSGWVKMGEDSHETWWLPDCTRIEPEPVVLTATYRIGQKVRVRTGGCEFTVNRMSMGYLADVPSLGDVWFREDTIEPVPTPCPACKGSGVSEGSA